MSGDRQIVYELIDGAAQTVVIYSTREAAEAHVADDSSLEVVERTVQDEYVRLAASWRE